MSETHFRKLENMYLSAPNNEYYHPAIHISEGHAEVSIAVRPDFFHTANAVHGSVYFKLMDDAAFFAANSLVEDAFVLTTSFTVYLTRPVTEGTMTGIGTVMNRSRRLIIAEAQVVTADGTVVARGSGTFMPSRMPLTPAIGYKL